ncbi:MAG: chromosomal replication initiator protein DnaA [Acetobacteraceae bacterium]
MSVTVSCSTAEAEASLDQGAPANGTTASAAGGWSRVRQRLRTEVGEAEYRAWLRQMTIGPVEGDELTLHLPTRFLRDWVRSHYGERLNALWHSENPSIRRVDIRVGRDLTRDQAEPELAQPTAGSASAVMAPAVPEASPNGARTGGRMDGRDAFGVMLEPRFTFDRFVIGKPNEFAYACARRVAGLPASVGFNPLFLYGGVGLGKTHLMHAIAWELAEGPSERRTTVAYMSAERFMYRFIAAIRSQSTIEFKDQLRSVGVLMVDDLQFLIGKDNTQEEFFHTFNALVDAGKQIVVSADKSPSDLSGLEDRLRTRLGCGMVADLHATTYELRLSILEAKAAAAAVTVPPKVLEYLAQRISSNVRELEGALNRLIAHANLFGREISLETTQEVLHDILRAHDRRITIEEIQRKVVEHWNLRLTDMASSRRARAVARPRQVAMYLAKQLTSRSLPEIGRRFGNRDHTTVMHAVARVGELMERDATFGQEVETLRRLLEG